MITISLCMIVKNEEKLLARCLESVKDAVDEIIIVDTGSGDRTKEIAAGYTDKIYDFEWIDDFSAARNFAFSKASMDYQMWLDADDVLPESEREKLLELKASLTADVDIVTMKYHTHFDPSGNPIFTSTRERLLRRERGYRWQEPVHECIPLIGNVQSSDICIWHLKPPSNTVSTRNLEIYEQLEASGKALSPRQQYYFARENRDHGRFAKAAYYFERFLAEGRGWAEDNIGACLALGECYRRLGDGARVLPSLIRSFEYDAPRGEICCEIAYCFKRKGDFKAALAWFQLATRLDFAEIVGFVQRDFYDYIPNIESCVCCCMLGQFDKAKHFNELAKLAKPDSDAVKQNEVYLADK